MCKSYTTSIPDIKLYSIYVRLFSFPMRTRVKLQHGNTNFTLQGERKVLVISQFLASFTAPPGGRGPGECTTGRGEGTEKNTAVNPRSVSFCKIYDNNKVPCDGVRSGVFRFYMYCGCGKELGPLSATGRCNREARPRGTGAPFGVYWKDNWKI